MTNALEGKPMVFMTKQDFDTLLKEQVQAMVAAQMAVAPSDMSVKGETIKPLLVNGVKYITRSGHVFCLTTPRLSLTLKYYVENPIQPTGLVACPF